MDRREKIFLLLLLVGFGAILLANRAGFSVGAIDPASAQTPPPAPAIPSNATGPSYVTYNAPWNFAPPVGNFLPPIVAGQVGQTVINPSAIQTPQSADNCGTC